MKKGCKKICALSLVIAMIFGMSTTTLAQETSAQESVHEGILVADKVQKPEGKWIKDSNGWWYRNPDGSYPANQWKVLNGSWYYFGENGYMYEQGWHWINGKCYYMYSNGAMASNTWIDGSYVDASGAWVAERWVHDSKGWWYRNSDGSYPVNHWKFIDGNWYYFGKNGYMYEQGWHWIDGKCYYMYSNGAMASNTWIDGSYVDASGVWVQPQWKQSGSKWWYCRADGSYPINCWEEIGGKWYHFDSSGWMQTGWTSVGSKWYYLNNDGAMLANAWTPDGCYVGADGAMLTNTWTPDGQYVGADGKVEAKPVEPEKPSKPEISVAWKEEMLHLVNAERAKVGAGPLKLYDPVNKTSQEKAEDMYAKGVLDHYSDTLGYFYDQFNKIGLEYTAGAENIAVGYPNVQSVMKGWMESQGHRTNILNPEYTHVGFGYHKGYWAQQFVKNPNLGETMNCLNCGSKINKNKYMISEDWEGNIYKVYQCMNCIALNEKCPKCETGFFVDAGLNHLGSLSKKCNVCGHQQSEVCITNCQFCNAEMLNDTHYTEYRITFDSTKTYDGDKYIPEPDGFSSWIHTSQVVCDSCGKIVIPQTGDGYEEFYGKLKEVLDRKYGSYDIFEYITWQKVIDKVEVGQSGNTTYYKYVFETVKTPHICSLQELKGKQEL